jgi:hypothetical protein
MRGPWTAKFAAHRNNHEKENGSDPPGLQPSFKPNSNGSLPPPTLPKASKWTSKFLDMSVKCKEIYMEFTRVAFVFMWWLCSG